MLLGPASTFLPGKEGQDHPLQSGSNGALYIDVEGLEVLEACPFGTVIHDGKCRGEAFPVSREEARAICESVGAGNEKGSLPSESMMERLQGALSARTPMEKSVSESFFWIQEGKKYRLWKEGKGTVSLNGKALLRCVRSWTGDPEDLPGAIDLYQEKPIQEKSLRTRLREFNDLLRIAYEKGGVDTRSFVVRLRPYLEPGQDRDRLAVGLYNSYQGVREHILLGNPYLEEWEIHSVQVDPLFGVALVQWERFVDRGTGTGKKSDGIYSETWKRIGNRWTFSLTQP